ncbi:hypothetical protein RR42_s0677 [Cupriavidus basilensis]|uniref:Uncharacterized protein n=1 Tax=Cupriavidus basilensis TaxID=68895 RepID=A0A0C4YH21_9BURK|nr:hypothetical protein RR42_s0677 [Cupriavidus basilensis]
MASTPAGEPSRPHSPAQYVAPKSMSAIASDAVVLASLVATQAT